MDDRDVFDELLAEELEAGMSRADVLKRGAAAGAGDLRALGALRRRDRAGGDGSAVADADLLPVDLRAVPRHPEGRSTRTTRRTHKLDAKIAPVQGFGIDRFVAEAKKKKSTWDVYVGMTPFVEMGALIESGHDRAVGQVHPEVGARRPDPVDPAGGDLQGAHLVVPVPARHHHPGLERRARQEGRASTRTRRRRRGIEFIANAKKVVSSKAAPYGAVFDAHGWRSLAPIAHTFNTNVYTPEGLFDFTNEAVVNALEIMKRLMEVAPKNILEEGKVDGGVNTTPDEEAFAGRQAAYYVKYQNAPTRFAGTWPDPKVLHIAGLPKARSGGGTVFWNTGAALFKYGENKQQAADYMEFLTYDMRIWQHALGKDVRGASGQLSPYQSHWAKWVKSPPPWMADWAFTVRKELATSKAIRTHKFGLTQFVIGKPAWEAYLKGDEKNPKKALAKAKALVAAEVKKSRKG